MYVCIFEVARILSLTGPFGEEDAQLVIEIFWRAISVAHVSICAVKYIGAFVAGSFVAAIRNTVRAGSVMLGFFEETFDLELGGHSDVAAVNSDTVFVDEFLCMYPVDGPAVEYIAPILHDFFCFPSALNVTAPCALMMPTLIARRSNADQSWSQRLI